MTVSRIEKWLGWRNLSQQEIIDTNDIVGNGVIDDARYINLTGATEVNTREGIFYFKDEAFALLALSKGILEREDEPTRDSLKEQFGETEHILGSRAGKSHSLYVYPEQGIAFSAGVSGLDFMQIFPPTNIDTYTATYYKEPKFR